MEFMMDMMLPKNIKEILAQEKQAIKTHVVVRNPSLFASFVGLINRITRNDSFSVCTTANVCGNFSYDHYFLRFGNDIIFEFGGGELSNAVVQVSICPPRVNSVVKEVIKVADWNIYIKRMAQLIGMNSYSICLRNCEHVVNYILTEKWISSQITRTMDQNLFFDIYRRVNKIDFSHFLGNIPDKIELSEEELNHLQEAGQVTVVSKKKRVDQIPEMASTFDQSYYNISYSGNDKTGSLITANTYVILLLGPTGAGKSRIVNLFFNYIEGDGIAESIMSADSVNKEMIFYYGTINPRNKPAKHLCLIDTIGLCDSRMSDDDVVALIKNKVNGLRFGLDHVILTFHGRMESPQKAAVEAVLKYIQLQPDHVSIFITKTDMITSVVKEAYKDSWLSSDLIQRLKMVRTGYDHISGTEVRVDNFTLIGMPNPTEIDQELVSLEGSRKKSVEARNEMLMRSLYFTNRKIPLDNLTFFQKYFGCNIL